MQVCLSLLECFTVLDGFLCSLSPASITLHYLQAPPIPIQQLLHVLPLPPLPTSLQTTEPVGFLVPGSPRHLMHVQLCRLLASVCMRVDPLVVEELVLPVVNDFLEIYAHTYPQLAEQEEGAAAESRRAVLLMIEDLWVQLEGLIMADRNRPQLSANVLTRVRDTDTTGAVLDGCQWSRWWWWSSWLRVASCECRCCHGSRPSPAHHHHRCNHSPTSGNHRTGSTTTRCTKVGRESARPPAPSPQPASSSTSWAVRWQARAAAAASPVAARA